MGTKNRPGKFDCYVKADPDEPMFVLLGRDKFAPKLVELWAYFAALIGMKDKAVEAKACANAMRKWRRALKDRWRVHCQLTFNCGWSGIRTGPQPTVQDKSCPKCGAAVKASWRVYF